MNSIKNNLNTCLNKKFNNSGKKYIRAVFEEYNPETGEVYGSTEYAYEKKQSKKGWAIMYKTDMREAIASISDKPSVLKVWLWLWDKMKKDGTIAIPKITKMAKELEMSRQTISKALKTLKGEKIIEQDEYGVWYYNPFLFIISGTTDYDRHTMQQFWEENFGHYDFYKFRRSEK